MGSRPRAGARPRVSRPDRLAVVCGTATDVGKTWVACALLRGLRRRGIPVAASKPAQSFASNGQATDAERLAAASGQSPRDVCPAHRWYPAAMAPPMAAEALGRKAITVAGLAAELEWPPLAAVGIVESAGGVRSPLASDGDTVTLCRLLAPDLAILVASAGLGTINAVRLSARALADGGAPIVVYLNRYQAADGLHRRNREWLAGRDGFDVVISVGQLMRRLLAPSPEHVLPGHGRPIRSARSLTTTSAPCARSSSP
ncbi:MAG: dethiobiotin synthase [Actinobacteria bacterium]|nr:dethiobiotin synthase [Actinomycetota bacterium]